MKITQLKLPLKVIINSDVENLRVVSIDDTYSYTDKVRSENPTGFAVTVVEEKHFEKFKVKIIGGGEPFMTQEEIEKSDEPIYVQFEEFEASFYMNKSINDYSLTCKAKTCKVVKPSKQNKKEGLLG